MRGLEAKDIGWDRQEGRASTLPTRTTSCEMDISMWWTSSQGGEDRRWEESNCPAVEPGKPRPGVGKGDFLGVKTHRTLPDVVWNRLERWPAARSSKPITFLLATGSVPMSYAHTDGDYAR